MGLTLQRIDRDTPMPSYQIAVMSPNAGGHDDDIYDDAFGRRICEVEVLAASRSLYDDDEFHSLDTQCLEAGTPKPGACAAFGALTTPAESTSSGMRSGAATVKVGESSWGEDNKTINFAIDVSVDRTMTGELEAEVRCKTKGGTQTDDVTLDHVALSQMRPGETTRVAGTAFDMGGLSQVPARCEIELTVDGTSQTVAHVCWIGHGVRRGAC